jgi:hypothetical protein
VTTVTQVRLTVKPVTLRAANRMVGIEHRHHAPTTGHRWSTSVVDPDGEVRGVAIMGRPVSRVLDGRGWVEVLRVCTDGTPNACSALYGAAARQAAAMGWPRWQVFTYTRRDEPGTSLVAAGWVRVAESGGGEWSRGTRLRRPADDPEPKVRWHAEAPPAHLYDEAAVVLRAKGTSE